LFKKILVPYDGSDVSRHGLEKSVALAKSLGASVVGFHVAPDIDASVRAYLPEAAYLPEDVKEQAQAAAQSLLAEVTSACKAAGVTCTTDFVVSEFVADAIIQAASDHQCDLIAIASHGRTGLARVMLGSETQKVLAHAKLPVLVMR